VSVDSSQLRLKSKQLDVVLDPEVQRKKPATPDARTAGTEMAVKQVIATDEVHAVVTDEQKKNQAIDCQRLACDLDKAPDGRAYLRVLNADGDVHTTGAEGELTCGHLDATLLPSTQPASATQPAIAVASDVVAPATAPSNANTDFSQMQIETLYASQNVRGKTADGRLIEGDRVKLMQTDVGPRYEITGTPVARVGDGTNTIVGPAIFMSPRAGLADVIGEGAMHGVQEQGAKSPGQAPATQPIDVTWKQQLNANMKSNEVRILGGVVATSKLDDGSTNVAHGELLVMTLTDAPTEPTTQPTTQPAAAPAGAPAATQPGKRHHDRATTGPTTSASSTSGMLGGADFELFRNKVVRTVTLSRGQSEDQVDVRSTLLAADGTLQRRINLFAPLLNYEMESHKLIVPSAGRLLYQDERGAATQPTTGPTPGPTTASVKPPAPAPNQPGGALGDTKGAMAFQWNKEFVYDDAARTATMTGDVLLVHQTPTGAEAYRMNAQRLLAEMQPPEPKDKSKPPGATTKLTTTKSSEDLAGGAKLKRLIADGAIVFNAQRLQFLADHIEFDPATQLLFARGGGPNSPAVLLDANGLSQGTFSEMYYDSAKDQMRLVNFRAAIRK
jgi:hypothetical protein